MSQHDGVTEQVGRKGVAPDFTSHPKADFPRVGELLVPLVSTSITHVIFRLS